MDYAVRLGRRALGTTAENPPVGCVIVKNERLLGVGWTQPGGRPHAETEALAMAGETARGATAYVTLEPCAHDGRTPPCAEALVLAGVARVVSAVEDPDPRVSGRGHAILRTAGISVESGASAARDLAGFFTRIIRKRPYVIMKLAFSADKKIASAHGQRTAITGPESQARVHLLRAQCDAILVGIGTALIDNPSLTCRLPGMEQRSPKPYVLSRNRDVPNFTVLRGSIPEALQALPANRLLVEGGGMIASAFLEAGLVDEIQLFQSPNTLGTQGVDGPTLHLESFSLFEQELLGADRLSVYHSVLPWEKV